jgi:GDP-6-deoxy-D-talose 4-dehydrogenase
MRVALTGANGFTGGFVWRALEAAGASCVDVSVDLRDPDAIARAVEDMAFDRLVHLAGHAFVDAADWASFYEVNQLGTYNLLHALARFKPGIRCVLAGSAQVYGRGSRGLLREDAPTRPANHYAVSKRAMELGADLWRDDLDIIVTRPFNYTGIGQSEDYLIPKIVGHFRRGETMIELGNTWVKRDFGDVRSVADAYVGLALAEAVPPVVNICTGRVSSIEEIVAELTAMTGHKIEIQVNSRFVRANDVPVLGGDAGLLRETLPSWQPRTLSDTLSWMINAD